MWRWHWRSQAREGEQDPLDFVTLSYGEHRLCLKEGARTTLCVLARSEVNLATLRMATRLALRRIEQGATS